MYTKLLCIVLLYFQVVVCYAQTISGSVPQAKNKKIVLKSYNGIAEQELATTTIDSTGNFMLNYPTTYRGAVLLQLQNEKSVIVLLNNENCILQWENLQDFTTLKFINSPENEAFAKGILANQEAEKKLAGLNYLIPLYKNNATQENWLNKEIIIQKQYFENFIAGLPKDSYVKYYLTWRKLLGEVQLNQERYKEVSRVKEHELAFKKIDFANDELWHSGLVAELLNRYYQVLELYQDKEVILKKSIEANDVWLKSLEKQPAKQQELAEFCFALLEKKGITKASAHIALTMLNKSNCQLTSKQTDLFEQYRKLAIGNTAPNIVFDTLVTHSNSKDLKELQHKYKLVVFGASWCPNCQNDFPSLIGKYHTLKEKYDLEVIYVSIDSDKKTFDDYYKEAPFMTIFDGKGWETQAAKDYHVFATPSYFLLDSALKILAKPGNPQEFELFFSQK